MNTEITNKKAENQSAVSSRISNLSLGAKHKLFALWMSTERLEGSRTLDLMFELDDIYLKKYNENTIKEGFVASRLLAIEFMLAVVYGY